MPLGFSGGQKPDGKALSSASSLLAFCQTSHAKSLLINQSILYYLAGSSSVSSVRIFQVSTIERNLERPEEDLNDPGSQLPNQILSETDSGQNLNGFNLLWLISARIHHQNSSRGRTPHRSSSSSRRLSNHGVHLHSKLPKRILRYHRPANYINPLRVSKRTKEKHVGFETEFRLRNTSGSG